jgi:hypothetical protein
MAHQHGSCCSLNRKRMLTSTRRLQPTAQANCTCRFQLHMLMLQMSGPCGYAATAATVQAVSQFHCFRGTQTLTVMPDTVTSLTLPNMPGMSVSGRMSIICKSQDSLLCGMGPQHEAIRDWICWLMVKSTP